MIYEIIHKTSYLYSGPVSHCHSKMWLHPRDLPYQECTEIAFSIEPEPAVFYRVEDFYDNIVHYCAVQQSHKSLEVKVKSRLKISARNEQAMYGHDQPWETVREKLSTFHPEYVSVYHFKYESQHVSVSAELFQYAALSFRPGRGLLASVKDLMARVFKDFRFVTGHTTISTPLDTIMKNRKGVCQDFAHLCIAFLRSHGLAARYVSGYIETLPPPGKPKLAGSDASHAWVSVYLPGQGWFDFDPTNNLIPSDQHITLAWGRDYADVSPMKGVVFSTGKQALQVEVDVKRVPDA